MARPGLPKYLHVPQEIYTLDLTDKQKMVFSNIASVLTGGGYYEFDNQWVSEWLGVSTRSASGIVNALVKKGFIDSTLIYKDGSKQIAKRVLKLTSIGMELLKVTPRNMNDGGMEADFPDNTKCSSSLDNKNKDKTNTIPVLRKMAFEEFWELYDYKVGRDKAFQKFQKIPATEYSAILEYLPEYVKTTHKDGSFPSRKHPSTFLHNKGWLDELPANDETARNMWEAKMKGVV